MKNRVPHRVSPGEANMEQFRASWKTCLQSRGKDVFMVDRSMYVPQENPLMQ